VECQIFADIPKKDKVPRKFPVTSIFERFALDYVGPLPTSNGNQHMLVATEYFTKWPIVKAVQKADQETTARFLYEEIYAQFGPPSEFLTDNGGHFDNITFANFCAMVRTKHKFSSPYHPQTNGQVERFNGTLVKALKKLSMSFPRNWDDHIPAVMFAYRTRCHSTIGVSPFELMYGTTPRAHEGDLLLQLGRRLGNERLYYMQSREPEWEVSQAGDGVEDSPRVDKLAVGDKALRVLHKSGGKLAPKFDTAPHLVLACLGNGSYKLATQEGLVLKRAVNGSHLQKWIDRPSHLQ
jgi:hypothetical protein